MGNIFISHVIADEPLMRELVQGLEQAGYTAWFFERDVLPGPSYLIQITQAMEECDAVVLLVTPAALSSDQVSKEVVGAFERRIPFLPVLVGVTPPELKEKQPEWRHALGGTAMLCAEDISSCLPRVVEGLRALGISPGGEVVSSTSPGISAPSYISEKILSTRTSLEGERKQVTVVFCDVVGFTPLSESLDPEEVGDLIRPAVDIMAEEIHTYEGTIAQFLGDGLMALFGAPLAHEDAPHRALYAALAMQRRLREYGEKLQPKGIEFQVRIGVNTGLVIVGRIGDDLTMEYTALGDTVNLASRMESAAEPGTVQIAESTYRLTEGYFDFSDLGEIEVKGKEQPVHAWQVLKSLPTQTRISASLSRGLSPFVGREWELESLTRSFQQAKAGHGQVVGMVGEPGVGKSRLLLQFRELLHENEYTYLEGGCIHYGEAIAYLPILGILRSYFDITEGENEAESKQKINNKLSSFNGQLAHLLPPLQELLSITVEDDSYLSLEPAQRRERVFEAIRYLFMAESQAKPLILAIEDLHWIDKTSEEFLSSFIEGMPTSSILLLLLYRPDYTPAWVSKTFYSQIRVDNLPQESSLELMKAILSEGEVSPEISDLIMEKAAGNPLFIEELTRGLLEAGSIIKDNERYVLSASPSAISVPNTIQGIIASRLDRLPDEFKETIQVASVIGREFSLRLLEEVTGVTRPLKSSLMHLQSLEFIYEKSLFPEPEYIFKHALTQEVTYNNLLLKQRKELHGRIGQAIEGLYPDNLDDFYETLAYHYSRSEDTDKAIRYLKLAGDKSARNYSNWEAVRFYREAIRLLDDQPESISNEPLKMVIYLSMLNPELIQLPEDSLEILHGAEKLAEEIGDDTNLAMVYSNSSHYYSMKGDMSLGLEYAEKCIDAAEKIGDLEIMAMAAYGIEPLMLFTGRWLELGAISRRVIELFEEQHRERYLLAGGFNLFASQCGYCGFASASVGEFDKGKVVLEKGLKITREVGETWGMGWVEYAYSNLCLLEGDVKGIIDHARKAIECYEASGGHFVLGIVWALQGLGYSFLGEHGVALKYAEKGLDLAEQSGIPTILPIIHNNLAVIRSAIGDLVGAQENAEVAVRMSRELGAKAIEAFALETLGRTMVSANPSQVDVAEEYIRQGISLCNELQFKTEVATGYLYLGEIFEITGRREEALENLRIADSMYREMRVAPHTYHLTRTQEALARLG